MWRYYPLTAMELGSLFFGFLTGFIFEENIILAADTGKSLDRYYFKIA